MFLWLFEGFDFVDVNIVVEDVIDGEAVLDEMNERNRICEGGAAFYIEHIDDFPQCSLALRTLSFVIAALQREAVNLLSMEDVCW